jgi:hypothetical protein
MQNAINQNYPPELSAWLLKELSDVKHLLQEIKQSPEITTAWIPRSQVMQFFGYGDTQMATLERSGGLVVTKVGNRKFIHRDSILQLLQNNIQGA